MQSALYLRTIQYILLTEYHIFKQTIVEKFIDLCIWVFTMTPIVIYLFPAFGMSSSYGAFMIVGMAASSGLFEQWSSTVKLVSDFETDNVTAFYLTLPMPSWLTFISYMIFYAFNTAVLSISVIPLCKLAFWNHFDLAHMNIIAYLLMFIVTNLFYATFTLWLISMVPSLERIGSVWMRFIYPLWTFGAFQYSYKVLYDFSPKLAYISLANPFTYIMEGTRAAVLGQAGYLSVWHCAIMGIFFSALCATHAIMRLKKRLDFV